MININKNFQIKVSYTKKNSSLTQNITLKIYKKKNVLNGSWKWLNDNRITFFMDKGYEKNTLKKQLSYYNSINNSKADILFAIYSKKIHIGNVGLHQINFKNKTAQFGIIIGNTNYHKKGIGKNVWQSIINFGFNNLKIKKIYTMIVADNIASKKIAKYLGFKKMKRKYYIIKNGIKFDYPKYYLTPKLFRKNI